MFLNDLIKNFLPKDKVFFSLFEEMGDNVFTMGILLDEMVGNANLNERNAISIKIEDLEHLNDELTHKIFVELGQNFITPFDREDIHYLATALDDVADYIHACSKKITLYKLDPTSDIAISKFSELIKLSCEQVRIIVKDLKNMRKSTEISNALIKINSIENQADDVYDLSIESLFEHENDIKLMIKKRELFQMMEMVSDKCEDVSNVIETILIKYS
ncbi:MAG: DUF47 family protein [Chitinophagales bacterium]|nr:DUF47 family protein [Chitinophagales bacterium]MCZ2394477.1 DUF47 family protein [Chitinophagales bacterium]